MKKRVMIAILTAALLLLPSLVPAAAHAACPRKNHFFGKPQRVSRVMRGKKQPHKKHKRARKPYSQHKRRNTAYHKH